MTHEQLAANNFLSDLPQKTRAKLTRIAIKRRTTIAALIKEGLLQVADDIDASGDKGPRPTSAAGYRNANVA